MKLDTLDDPQLVGLISKGSRDALAEAYRRHSGPVYGLALRLVRDRELAEDISQEVFLKLWNQSAKYDAARGSLRSFLLAHTHGRSIDLIRSEGARRRREEREARLAPLTPATSIEHDVIDLTRAEATRTALDEINETERQAIELAYFGGYTYREVAEILDEPEGTIKSRIRSGMKRMHTLLVSAGMATTNSPDS